jgi:hypothetical protein
MDSLPTVIMDELQRCSDRFEEQLDHVLTKLRDIVDGTSKKEATDWWLSKIETETNQFLCDRGYALNALPVEYLDVPPRDFDVVKENLKILKDILSGNDSGLDEFLNKIVTDVYVILDRHMEQVKFVLDTDFEDMKLPNFQVTKDQQDSLRNDLEYLIEMKRMDEEIMEDRKRGEKKSRKLEMTHVVPVGGLVMARFHIFECEIQSSLACFRHLHQPPSPLSPSTPSSSRREREKDSGSSALNSSMLGKSANMKGTSDFPLDFMESGEDPTLLSCLQFILNRPSPLSLSSAASYQNVHLPESQSASAVDPPSPLSLPSMGLSSSSSSVPSSSSSRSQSPSHIASVLPYSARSSSLPPPLSSSSLSLPPPLPSSTAKSQHDVNLNLTME